jgi:glycosyltransferase involved in cell wall biosynthesis
MARKIKILLVTHSPALPTGLAETTRLIFTNLLQSYPEAYEIHQVGLFHCYAVTDLRWPVHATALTKGRNGPVHFDPNDHYGQRTFNKVVGKVQPDIVFAFGDPQQVMHLCKPPDKRPYRLVLYVNFDGLPLPPDFGPVFNHADLVITKSEFSKNVLLRYLPAVAAEKVSNLYSPADIRRFAPVSAEEKLKLREDLFPDWMPRDSFVLGWVGRNQWRKQVWLLYKAIAYMRRGHYLVCRHCGRMSPLEWTPDDSEATYIQGLAKESRPDYDYSACAHCSSPDIEKAEPRPDIFLWMHMAEEPVEPWPLRRLEEQFGIERNRDIYHTPGYEVKKALSPTDMPMLYNIWDALLYVSGGEGFGLPAWEAMCSGVPAIYTNYSGHADFLNKANAGLPVGGVLQPESTTCIWRMVADLSQVIEAIRRLYYDRELASSLGANGRAFVEGFTPEIVVSKWHEIFQNVAATGRPDLVSK